MEKMKKETLTIMRPKPNLPATDYLSLVGRCVIENGYEILDFNSCFMDDEILDKVSIVNFNWYEGISQKHNFIKYAYFALRKAKHYLRMKKKNIRIIYTFHNKKSHDKWNHSRIITIIDKMLITFLLKFADRIVVLSEFSKFILRDFHLSAKEIENKVCVINHMSYYDVYKNFKAQKLQELKTIKNNTMKVLFFGTIAKYKNINLIMKLAEEMKDKNVSFIIAGKVESDEYKEKIKEWSNYKNVNLIPRYILIEEVIALFDLADICVMPLDITSSINSGSMCLSFTLSTPVVGPEIGTMLDFPKEYNFPYFYKNKKEHYKKLKDAFLEAYKIWQDNPDDLKRRGELLFKYLEKNYSYEITKEKYKKLYDSLIC